MLSPDDYTQPIAPRAGTRTTNHAHSEVDSKLEANGPGPKMVSLTMPAFGLICATVAIGFACAFVIGRMTVTPVQAANVETAADAAAASVPDLSALTDPLQITPTDSNTAAPADAATPASTAPQSLWGYQVMSYKGEAVSLADKFKDNLDAKGIEEVTILKSKDTARVIVGGCPSYKALEKAWKQKLTEKGFRADPVKYTPEAQ